MFTNASRRARGVAAVTPAKSLQKVYNSRGHGWAPCDIMISWWQSTKEAHDDGEPRGAPRAPRPAAVAVAARWRRVAGCDPRARRAAPRGARGVGAGEEGMVTRGDEGIWHEDCDSHMRNMRDPEYARGYSETRQIQAISAPGSELREQLYLEQEAQWAREGFDG